LLKIN